jgi:hypothetical protein
MLGDDRLSDQLGKVKEDGLGQEDLRKCTIEVLEARYNELTRPQGRQNQQRAKARATVSR